MKACLPENHGLQATEDEKPLALQRIAILGQIVWAPRIDSEAPTRLGVKLLLTVGFVCGRLLSEFKQGLRSTGVSLATMSAVRKSQGHQ